ncbi:MAG: hypothetical protein CVU97_03345 [Firmicutes bacterium HGW-Firmicutes-21]|nr:MAG: hypothetical protein CVU97_03345 [Firmicutes bacterium HGW-Firmicutes-21]
MSKTVSVYKGNQLIVEEAVLADTFFNRLFGLLPTKALDENNGIILVPCRQIHTFHMKYSIDAVFLAENNTIIHIEHNLVPNRTTKYLKKARSVLEIKGGTAEKYALTVGDALEIGMFVK